MARIIAVAVPTGGAGETSTTLNLGAALAERGQRVLANAFARRTGQDPDAAYAALIADPPAAVPPPQP